MILHPQLNPSNDEIHMEYRCFEKSLYFEDIKIIREEILDKKIIMRDGIKYYYYMNRWLKL